MFDRFTNDARAVVVSSEMHARRLAHREIAPVHLLLGLTSHGARWGAALAAIGITAESVESLARALVPSVAPAPARWLPPRRRGDAARASVPFDAASKKSLEHALKQALALKDDHIGPRHLGLGVVAAGDRTVTDVLEALRTTPAKVRETLLAVGAG